MPSVLSLRGGAFESWFERGEVGTIIWHELGCKRLSVLEARTEGSLRQAAIERSALSQQLKLLKRGQLCMDRLRDVHDALA